MVAPTLEQVVTAQSGVTGTTLPLVTTASIPVGRTLILCIERGLTGAPGVSGVTTSAGATSGWTREAAAARANTHDLTMMVTQVTTVIPSGTTLTVTYASSATRRAAVLAVFDQVNSKFSDSSSGKVYGADATISIGPNGTTAGMTATATTATVWADQLVVGMFSVAGAATTVAPDTGMTFIGEAKTAIGTGDRGVNVAYKVVRTAGIQSASATQSASSVWAAGMATFPITGTSASLFAGHIPNRVLVGMATPAENTNVDPGWNEARTIIGQPIYEARRFEGTGYNASALASMLAEADAANAYPVLSFKYSNWAQVAQGAEDADLISIFNAAKARQAAGKGPFSMSFHHEPAGDDTPTNGGLAGWAQMNVYCAWFFGGRRGGTATSPYDPAHDISTGASGTTQCMSWAPVGNGFWWRTSGMWTPANSDANTAYPQAAIDALRINKGIILNDFYDTDYVDQDGALTNESLRTPDFGGVRTSARITQFMNWARLKNAGACGCGEFGVIDGSEMTATWVVMRNNRDLWAIANQFNSQNNSDHEWRIVPADYPDGNPTGSKGLVDFGGNAQSAGRLAAFKTMLTQSVSATYTSPLGTVVPPGPGAPTMGSVVVGGVKKTITGQWVIVGGVKKSVASVSVVVGGVKKTLSGGTGVGTPGDDFGAAFGTSPFGGTP